MRRGIFAGIGMTFALGGCILIDTYQSDTYKPQETSSASSSSTSTGMGGAGGLAGQGGATSQGGNGGMAGMAGMAGMGGMGGAVEPPGTVEICGNDIDEDASGTTCPLHVATWNARFGDQAMQRARRVVLTSAASEILFGGDYDGLINIGSSMNPITVADGTGADKYQAFVARLGSDATPKWILHDGLVNQGHAADIVVYEIGSDTYWTGARFDRANVTKIKSMGSVDWTTTAFANAPGSRGSAVALAAMGSQLYVAGTVTGSGTFDCAEVPKPAYNVGSSSALFLAAINPSDGKCIWAEIYAGGDVDPGSVSLKYFGGSPVIAGTYRTPISGPGWPDVTMGGSGIFFLAADPTTGTISKSRGYVTAGAGEINVRRMQVMTTAKGNLFVTGSFRGKFATNLGVMDPISTSADNAVDAFVMSVNSTSNFDVQWINRFGGPNIQEGTGLAAMNGIVYATGISYGPMSPDPATTKGQMCNPNEGKCMYWIKMAGVDGTVAWAEPIGSKDFSANPIIDVAMNDTAVVLAGGWSQPIDFGDGIKKAVSGNLDIFVASYDAAKLP
ncbi:MAG TPA: hypothetical protein PKA58_05645 [Polyangium sp.]|nr:hypothetical protein [Polyangium sp.]